MILRTKGYWEFPKGRKIGDESDETTALRELREETALTGELLPTRPIVARYAFARNNERCQKEVRYYLCRVPDGSRVREERREVSDHVWVTLERLVDRATYPEMKEVARHAAELLAE